MESYNGDSIRFVDSNIDIPSESVILRNGSNAFLTKTPVHNSSYVDSKLYSYSQKFKALSSTPSDNYYQAYCPQYVNTNAAYSTAPSLNSNAMASLALHSGNTSSQIAKNTSNQPPKIIIGDSGPLPMHQQPQPGLSPSTNPLSLKMGSGPQGGPEPSPSSLPSELYRFKALQTSAYTSSPGFSQKSVPNSVHSYFSPRNPTLPESTIHPFIPNESYSDKLELSYVSNGGENKPSPNQGASLIPKANASNHFNIQLPVLTENLSDCASKSYPYNQTVSQNLPQIVPQNLPCSQSFLSNQSSNLSQVTLNMHSLNNQTNIQRMPPPHSSPNTSPIALYSNMMSAKTIPYASKTVIDQSRREHPNQYSSDLNLPTDSLQCLDSMHVVRSDGMNLTQQNNVISPEMQSATFVPSQCVSPPQCNSIAKSPQPPAYMEDLYHTGNYNNAQMGYVQRCYSSTEPQQANCVSVKSFNKQFYDKHQGANDYYCCSTLHCNPSEVNPPQEPAVLMAKKQVYPTEGDKKSYSNWQLKPEDKQTKKARVSADATKQCENSSAPGPRRSLRERKAVQLSEFVLPESYEDASLSEDNGDAIDDEALNNLQIVQGRGVKLGSIASFVQNYESMRTDSAAIRKLFQALYGTAGRPQIRKRYIFAWSGLPPDVDELYLAAELTRFCTVANLRDVGKKLFGLASGANGRDMKQAWITSVVSILANPQPHVIMLSTMFNSKDSRYNMTSFQLFYSEMRPLIVEERPNASNKELMQILGAKWRMLSPAEKYKYQAMFTQRKNCGSSGRKRGRRKKNDDTSDGEDERTYFDRTGEDEDYENDV